MARFNRAISFRSAPGPAECPRGEGLRQQDRSSQRQPAGPQLRHRHPPPLHTQSLAQRVAHLPHYVILRFHHACATVTPNQQTIGCLLLFFASLFFFVFFFSRGAGLGGRGRGEFGKITDVGSCDIMSVYYIYVLAVCGISLEILAFQFSFLSV